jgi:hypothetical protein
MNVNDNISIDEPRKSHQDASKKRIQTWLLVPNVGEVIKTKKKPPPPPPTGPQQIKINYAAIFVVTERMKILRGEENRKR